MLSLLFYIMLFKVMFMSNVNFSPPFYLELAVHLSPSLLNCVRNNSWKILSWFAVITRWCGFDSPSFSCEGSCQNPQLKFILKHVLSFANVVIQYPFFRQQCFYVFIEIYWKLGTPSLCIVYWARLYEWLCSPLASLCDTGILLFRTG